MPAFVRDDENTAKFDWRMLGIVIPTAITAAIFAAGSLWNYTQKSNDVDASMLTRISVLEAKVSSVDDRQKKDEARMELMIDTLQGINRDIFASVSKVQQKLDDHFGPPPPQIANMGNGK
jgi:hypothetical protein